MKFFIIALLFFSCTIDVEKESTQTVYDSIISYFPLDIPIFIYQYNSKKSDYVSFDSSNVLAEKISGIRKVQILNVDTSISNRALVEFEIEKTDTLVTILSDSSIFETVYRTSADTFSFVITDDTVSGNWPPSPETFWTPQYLSNHLLASSTAEPILVKGIQYESYVYEKYSLPSIDATYLKNIGLYQVEKRWLCTQAGCRKGFTRGMEKWTLQSFTKNNTEKKL